VKKQIRCLLVGFLFLALTTAAVAEDYEPTEREKELERTVQELEERVTDLEKQLKKERPQATPRKDELSRRVDRLEKYVQKWGEPSTLRAFWKEGLNFETSDETFKLKLGGRLMNDWVFWTGRDSDIESFLGDELEDGTEFRRARLYVSGSIYKRIRYKAQYDFAGGDADLKDAYLELTKLPVVGNVKVGHFKEPFGLEELTSSKYITFMERALPNVFAPSRNTGLMLHDHALDERMTWAVGVFRDSDDFGESTGTGEYNITGRITGLPWYEDKGRKLLHLGASYSVREASGDSLRLRQRPEVHLSPRFVDTGSFAADHLGLLGLETALVLGPASLQAEYMTADVDSSGYGDPEFSGWYVQGSYFLTGEHRSYKASEGAFSRVKPKKDFLQDGGVGAWEIAARYSNLDLDDSPIMGGELDNVTLGLNWHLNPNTRVMFDYVMADLEDVGDASAFMMRFQVDF